MSYGKNSTLNHYFRMMYVLKAGYKPVVSAAKGTDKVLNYDL